MCYKIGIGQRVQIQAFGSITDSLSLENYNAAISLP